MTDTGWETKKLNNVAKINMGQSPPSSTYNDEGKGLPFFQGKKEFGVLHPKVEKWCDEPKKIAEKNDLLISVRAPVGDVNIANQKSCIGRGLAAIRFEGNLKYLFYFIQAKKQELEKQGTGSTFKAISGKVLKNFPIPYPPLPTQNRIVAKIEELFSELDHGVENLKKAQKQLKTYRQAVLKDAFEGKLTKEWRTQQDNLPTPEELLQQIKAERKAHRQRELAEWEKEVEQWEKNGEPGRKPQKPRKAKELDPVDNENLAKLPSSWCYSRLQNLCTNIVDCLHSTPKFTTKGKYCIDTTCIEQGKINFEKIRYVDEETFEERNRRLVPKKGDVIFAREGTVGTSVVLQRDIDICLGQRVMIFRNIKSILPGYFMNVLQDPKFINRYKPLIGGTTSPHLNISDIRALIVPVPSKKEQVQILQEIESRVSVIDQLEQTIKENLQKAEGLRQSILKKAFGGELVEN